MTHYRITQEFNEDASDPIEAVRFSQDVNNLTYRVEDEVGSVWEVDLSVDPPTATPITPF